MNRKLPPALGVLELASIARGMVVADAMVKRAEVRLSRAQPITPGKFLIVVVGAEEEVAQAMERGREVGQGTIIDQLYLAQTADQLGSSLLQTRRDPVHHAPEQSVGIVETFSVASTILAADRALKAAEVQLGVLRLARGLGGKGFFVVGGSLPQVQAAVEAARSIAHHGMLLTTEVIPHPDPTFIEALQTSSEGA